MLFELKNPRNKFNMEKLEQPISNMLAFKNMWGIRSKNMLDSTKPGQNSNEKGLETLLTRTSTSSKKASIKWGLLITSW